jgi:hypothetical protein
MKTIAISTLSLLAFACAPNASIDSDDATSPELKGSMEASIEVALKRSITEEMVLKRARKEIGEIHQDMVESDMMLVGMISGSFDEREGIFKAIGFGLEGQQIYEISGDIDPIKDSSARWLLDGDFLSTTTGEAAEHVPEGGLWSGMATDHHYFGQQVAEGYSPLLHEGIWVESPAGGTGHFIGLVAKYL